MKNIDLYQLLSALSLAIDLSECSIIYESQNIIEAYSNINYSKHKFQNHSRRTCYVATQIAHIMSKDNDFSKRVFIASALHDIGASGEIDAAHTENTFIREHCINGFDLIKKLSLGASIPDIILYHHDNYDGSGEFSMKGDNIPLEAQIIRFADNFELMYDETRPNYLQRNSMSEWIREKRGTLFNPLIVDAYMDIQNKDAFWWDVENIGINSDILANFIPYFSQEVNLSYLKNIASVFAEIIDKKSPFTYTHSTHLSELAGKAADYLLFDTEKKETYQVSALLHDLGKLYVPNTILNKKGKLEGNEINIMRSHTYYTRAVLSKIDGFENITNWGANHHEKLNGKGYPYGISGDKLSIEERIMCVLDIYEALTADRPYRKGMTNREALCILNQMVQNNEICKESLKILYEII